MAAPRLVVLVGPTASGKTDLAVEAVEEAGVPAEILALDSRQLYRGLDVGTGKPSASQRARVPHHLLDFLDPAETYDAARYRSRAESVVGEVVDRGAVPLFVGGAGFYLRALREGFLDVDADPRRLRELRAEHDSMGEQELHDRLRAVDAETAERLHPNDRYRVGRALEIHRLTGRPLSEHEREFRPSPVLGAAFEVLHLSPDRARLHQRIEARTRRWLGGAWREEVEARLAEGLPPDCPGLRILGYREVVEWIEGRRSAAECEQEIITRTRQYARQQETWFRKEEAVWRGSEPEAGRRALVEALREAARRS